MSISSAKVRNAVEATSALFKEEPERAKTSTPAVTAALKDGLAFGVRGARGEILTDMPPPMGGDGRAETPGWHMRAGLAACIGTTIATRAAQLGITLTELEVSVLSEVDYRGLLGTDDRISPEMSNLRTKVKIGSPGTSEDKLIEIVRWGERHSPVARTIKSANLLDAAIQVGS